MLNKIYLAALLVCTIVAGFFAYYGWSWLQSIGDPRIGFENYGYHRTMGIYAMLISTAILIVLGNVLLWSRHSAWGLWVADAYFVVFALVFLVAINAAANSYCLENNLCQDPSRAAGILLTVFGGLALTALLFGDQFIVLRLREKTYGQRREASIEEKEYSRDESPES
jgi:uncharacterized membrane protein